jgi:hypothetical protein
MADLVNSTHKERLSPKNSEASNLKGGSYETLGGPTWDNTGGDDAYKIDAAKGIGTDTTIPKAVGAEASHLKTVAEDDELDIDFGDEGEGPSDVDDLDRELDQFEDAPPVEVSIDDEDDEQVKEETDAAEDGEKAKEDAKDDELQEDEQPPWLKKDGDKEEDDKEEVKEEDENPFAKKDDDDKEEVKEEDENPFAKKDDEEDKKVEEAVKIRIKLPDAKLFESANMSAKTQKKVGVVFEAAIRETTKQVAAQLHRHYKRLFESRSAKREAVLAKQMDSYLSYVVEEWNKANQVQIRQSLRAQLAEEFLSGLQRLFKEHYIAVPESKVNVVEKLTEEVQGLRRELNRVHGDKLKLRRLAEAANKARIVAEFGKGLSEAQGAKLQKLAESTPYTSAKDFREKVTLLKESYFASNPSAKAPKMTRLPEDDVQEQVVPKSLRQSNDPMIDTIAQALTQQAKASKW